MLMNNYACTIGSARIDENGKASGGAAGDQTGKEVSTQKFYNHSKGWLIFRAKSAKHAKALAKAMKKACSNDNIGYDQLQRNGIIKYGTKTKKKTECDCSSLVRRCIIEATGWDPSDWYTGSMPDILNKSPLFMPRIVYRDDVPLYTGDILVTAKKGHTAIVTKGNAR